MKPMSYWYSYATCLPWFDPLKEDDGDQQLKSSRKAASKFSDFVLHGKKYYDAIQRYMQIQYVSPGIHKTADLMSLIKRLHSRKSNAYLSKLSNELEECYYQIYKTSSQQYREIGKQLRLSPEEIKAIETEFEDEDDCLYQVILEWSKRSNNPSYQALITECNKVIPDILIKKPLHPLKVSVLEKCYCYLCTELLIPPILPSLISVGLMSFMQQQRLQEQQAMTADKRVSCLIKIIRTREEGFDELLNALDATNQKHVSDILRTTLGEMNCDRFYRGNSCQLTEDSSQKNDR